MDDKAKRVIPTPVTPTKTFNIESLGGEVVVHGLGMHGQDKVIAVMLKAGELEYAATAYLLSLAVRTPDGNPIMCGEGDDAIPMTPEMWDTWGGKYSKDARELSDAAYEYSGLDARLSAKK